MRHIDRLAEPGILTKKKAQWVADFLASGKNRPDSSKYGHKDILAALNNMSYNKCFYSEERLIAKPKNVDHLMEVAGILPHGVPTACLAETDEKGR